VHAREAVPTWMSQRSLQRVIVSSGARISNDRLRTGIGCARMTHPESLDIIILMRGACAGAARPQTNSFARGQKGTDAPPQKLTRPDGEIRAQGF
jgi:hypothetical protein